MKTYSDFKPFSKDQAYWERNQLVAALSKIYPSWMELHPIDDEKWEKDWRHIVFIEIPTTIKFIPYMTYINGNAQMSWHIHDSDVEDFSHLELRKGNSWDGHTTDEKYRRLRELRPKKWYQFWK